MTYDSIGLSVARGIANQTEHLAEWEALLKPEVFALLKARVTRDNGQQTSGYNVVRGDKIYELLVNEVRRSLK